MSRSISVAPWRRGFKTKCGFSFILSGIHGHKLSALTLCDARVRGFETRSAVLPAHIILSIGRAPRRTR